MYFTNYNLVFCGLLCSTCRLILHQAFIFHVPFIFFLAGCVDLDKVSSVVRSYSGTLIPLKKPKSYSVRVCGQDDTVYAGNEDQLEAWKDFYLPERLEMVVIGAIDDFPCDAFGLQLVLLLCEDGNIYAYEDEVLHLVARSVKELFKNGLTFPGLESYKMGECFEDYVSVYSVHQMLVSCSVEAFPCRYLSSVFQTEEEYNKIMESDDMKEMKKLHANFRDDLARNLLASIKEYEDSQFKVIFNG